MSPKSNLMSRDGVIRKLVPFVMRAAELDREVAKVLLASLSPDDRHVLWMIKSKAMGMKGRPR